ncbi:hypothetical protein G7048_16205 [Diaphorobacter sp. HDW4B]|uniref:c-type cytochrome n=1 Tax=Diaphorobacter sp. HDW4B TaxID=2714925 RepID=UPI0014089220|nr:c-type cytochrome [Diaphorobacter sp. HDW4B]QIL71765.1 hypothetical protein G7048_16205 [Diaphorobacter sp. HDW4B]
MSPHSALTLLLAAATGLAALQMPCSARASEPLPPWTPAAEQGRALFYGTRPFTQPATVSGAPMPASAVACVQCHGPLGEGSREANVAAPDIRWAAGKTSRLNLANALRDGRDATGRPLHPAMPRYALTHDEVAALDAFWPWLGNAAQPQSGISSNELRLGVALEGIAHADARAQVMAGVQSVLDQTNAAGGVHGRQLRLLPSDRGLPSDVFALVASALLPAQQKLLRDQRLPSIATLDVQARNADPSGWQWPLLPSLEQQARIAMEQLQNAPADCIRWTFDPRGLSISSETQRTPKWPAGTRLCVAAFAPAAEVDSLRSRWREAGITLKQLIELSGMRAKPLEAPELDHRLILFVPLAVADHAERQGQSLWFVLGQAAARTAVEALARSGRNVVPESLLAQARSLTGYAPLPGAPLAFSRSQAHGWQPEPFVSRPPASPASSPFSELRSRKELP